jgi:hypothetical protein
VGLSSSCVAPISRYNYQSLEIRFSSVWGESVGFGTNGSLRLRVITLSRGQETGVSYCERSKIDLGGNEGSMDI